MFVINANASGSASATAYAAGGGGNTTLTSANGYYEIPMNGSTYNMFREKEGCGDYCLLENSCTYTGWNGMNPNEESVLNYGIARSFDKEVLFPNNYVCNSSSSCSSCSAFENTVKTYINLPMPEHNLNEIVEIDLGEVPQVMVTRTVAKREFCGGEKIGRKITAEIGQSTDIATTLRMCECQSSAWYDCICCSTSTGNRWIARKCPIIHYVDLGLLHEDGTTSIISHIERKSSYACFSIDGDKINTCETPKEEEKFIKDSIKNEGVIACEGDRIYYEYGIKPICLLFDTYANERLTQSCAQNYGRFYRNSACGTIVKGMNTSLKRECINCRTMICSINDESRFNGIQFSIE